MTVLAVQSIIAGEAAGAGAAVALAEPATGAPLGEVHLATAADVDAAVGAARTALGRWGKTSPIERSRLLHALASAVDEHRDELVDLEVRNVGKAIREVAAEVAQAGRVLRFYASVTGQGGGSAQALSGSVLHYSLKVPVGVCAQIVPWNYPLLMAVWKLAPALAAGCTVVLKPDPSTPITAVMLARLALDAGFPEGVVNVVIGDGPTIGAQLVAHPGVDKVAFTGSTATGAEIMRLAGKPVKRVSLELGGKSPNLVFADADLDDAVPSAVWSIYTSAGQSCEARSRLLVERSVFDEVLDRFVARAGRLVVGDPLREATDMGSLISDAHRRRVQQHVDLARADGGDVLLGGAIPEGDGAFYPPTVVAGLGNDSALAQEEVFGPVVVVIPFDDEDEAVALANDVRFGLMASVWTRDGARAQRVANRLQSGTVGINMPYTSFPGVPFGGFKQSGVGRELASETVDLYTETRSVLTWTGTRPATPIAP